VEQPSVRAVTIEDKCVMLTVHGVPNVAGVAAGVFRALDGEQIDVDLIVQGDSRSGADISFTIPAQDAWRASRLLRKGTATLAPLDVSVDYEVGRVSLVGAGLRVDTDIASRVFDALGARNINIDIISMSSAEIALVLRRSSIPTAAAALREAFHLQLPVAAHAV